MPEGAQQSQAKGQQRLEKRWRQQPAQGTGSEIPQQQGDCQQDQLGTQQGGTLQLHPILYASNQHQPVRVLAVKHRAPFGESAAQIRQQAPASRL